MKKKGSDLVTIKDLEEFGKRLEERLEKSLEAKLETKLESKLETKLEAKLGISLETKLGTRLENTLDAKLESKFNEKLGKLYEDLKLWKSQIFDLVDDLGLEIRDGREHRQITSHQISENADRINKLEKKVFGVSSA